MLEQSQDEAERPWGEKEEQHQEREASGKPREKRTTMSAAKMSSFDLPAKRSLVTGGENGGAVCVMSGS